MKLSTNALTKRFAHNIMANKIENTKNAAAPLFASLSGAVSLPVESIATYMISCQLSPVEMMKICNNVKPILSE